MPPVSLKRLYGSVRVLSLNNGGLSWHNCGTWIRLHSRGESSLAHKGRFQEILDPWLASRRVRICRLQTTSSHGQQAYRARLAKYGRKTMRVGPGLGRSKSMDESRSEVGRSLWRLVLVAVWALEVLVLSVLLGQACLAAPNPLPPLLPCGQPSIRMVYRCRWCQFQTPASLNGRVCPRCQGPHGLPTRQCPFCDRPVLHSKAVPYFCPRCRRDISIRVWVREEPKVSMDEVRRGLYLERQAAYEEHLRKVRADMPPTPPNQVTGMVNGVLLMGDGRKITLAGCIVSAEGYRALARGVVGHIVSVEIDGVGVKFMGGTPAYVTLEDGSLLQAELLAKGGAVLDASREWSRSLELRSASQRRPRALRN